MRVFALLDRVAAIVGGVHQLARQARRHRVLAARTRGRDQPADGERLRPLRPNLDGNLIGRTADAPAADLDARLDVVQRVVQALNGVLLGLRPGRVERAIKDSLPDGRLVVYNTDVHQFSKTNNADIGEGQVSTLILAVCSYRVW